MTDHERAKAWRQKNGWTLDDLADLTGYSRSSIMWFERGVSPPKAGTYTPRKQNQYAFQRYKRACHSVEVETSKGKGWDWS
jgi:DNA-binding XRE family transcriptional regulator